MSNHATVAGHLPGVAVAAAKVKPKRANKVEVTYRQNKVSRTSAGIFFVQSHGEFAVKNVW